ncbi:uracil-DNA glycosylase [Klebsiella pneumoniae]|nr:uracil-DNA glycosylase [Klebsiella pneumoniae]
MTTPLTWHDVLADEKQQPYFLNTLKTVAEERQSGSPSIHRKKTSSMRFALLNWAMSKSSFSARTPITARVRPTVWRSQFVRASRSRLRC